MTATEAPATDGPLVQYRGRYFVLNPTLDDNGAEARELVASGEGYAGAVGTVIFLVMFIGAFALARFLGGLADPAPATAGEEFFQYALMPLVATFGFITFTFRGCAEWCCDRWVWSPKDPSVMMRVEHEQRDLVPAVEGRSFAGPEHQALWRATQSQAALRRMLAVGTQVPAEAVAAVRESGRLNKQIDAATAHLRATIPLSDAGQAIAAARALVDDLPT